MCGAVAVATAQKLQSPAEFLGYELGAQFTPHYRVVEYFRHVAENSEYVKLHQYGTTNENRPLLAAFVGSEDNLASLENIRANNMRLTGLEPGGATGSQPAIVWLSYNVHGNESVSTEAAMKTIYALVDPANKGTKAWLQNTVVIMDPCLNPDGRERYVNFYNSVKNTNADPLAFTREHLEPWPGGRSNHYYFDLNRDWAWQSQKETQQRMALYNKWLPQVHVDFHEQGINDPYYFAPAAEPYHEAITPWQREFQTTIGRNNARYFDEKGWMYFTKERFDLLYPSYGDTYPIYNGSIGMTFEQGGSGRAGLAVITASGDTLTLADRIEHHYTTGLSTIEVTSQNAARVVAEFKDYFSKSINKPDGEYKSYVIKATNSEKLKALAALLQRNDIRFGYGAAGKARGFNYFTGKTEAFSVEKNDLVISAYQPKSVLAKVLFEPRTFVADSNTYDITAWALPYAYGLQAYATREVIKPVTPDAPSTDSGSPPSGTAVAYVAGWNSMADVRFLASLLNKNIKVRYSEVPFESGGRKFGAGSLIITRTGNENLGTTFDKVVQDAAQTSGVSVHAISSGMVDRGADLGSSKVRFIQKPKIAVVLSDETSSLAYGEVWHLFEQQIGYPLSSIRARDIARINLGEFNVLIFPDGSYNDIGSDKIADWIRSGGKLIALENAVAQLVGKKGFNIRLKEEGKDKQKEKDPYANLKSYETRERDYLKSSIPGAIYKVNLDNTHPLGFGFPDFYYTLKLDDRVYDFMNSGWNVGVFKKDNYVTGFVGQTVKQKLVDGLVFGVQDMGSGSVVYLADDPLFRSFWESGKLLFSNAVFMVGH